jgi:hypothetical protein
MPRSTSAVKSLLANRRLKPINRPPQQKENKMPKRPDQKNKLTDLAELQNDPGRARGQDFRVQNENPERNKYAAKDRGKSELTGKGAPRPHRAPVKK